jgi:thioredoxin reductase
MSAADAALTFDLGVGPAGLTAAVYAASDSIPSCSPREIALETTPAVHSASV